MTVEQYFDTHKTVFNFQDGETVHIHVDGVGEVTTKLRRESIFGSNYLFDESGDCWGTLESWLKQTHPMQCILAPPETLWNSTQSCLKK